VWRRRTLVNEAQQQDDKKRRRVIVVEEHSHLQREGRLHILQAAHFARVSRTISETTNVRDPERRNGNEK
jgi:hypothetical protein